MRKWRRLQGWSIAEPYAMAADMTLGLHVWQNRHGPVSYGVYNGFGSNGIGVVYNAPVDFDTAKRYTQCVAHQYLRGNPMSADQCPICDKPYGDRRKVEMLDSHTLLTEDTHCDHCWMYSRQYAYGFDIERIGAVVLKVTYEAGEAEWAAYSMLAREAVVAGRSVYNCAGRDTLGLFRAIQGNPDDTTMWGALCDSLQEDCASETHVEACRANMRAIGELGGSFRLAVPETPDHVPSV